MKTLIIYNDCESIRYSIIDGDYSKFNNIFFNCNIKNKLEGECNNFMWNINGTLRLTFSDNISLIENKQWDKVALITFIP